MSSIAQRVVVALVCLLSAADGSIQHQHDHRAAHMSSLERAKPQRTRGAVVRKAISQDLSSDFDYTSRPSFLPRLHTEEAPDLRVCVLISVKDPLEMIRHGVRHFKDTLKVPSRSLNYIVHDVTSYRLPPKLQVLSVLQNSGVPMENIIEHSGIYTAKDQVQMFLNCTEASFRRWPSQGAPWISWMDVDELPVMPKGGQTFSEHIGEMVHNGLNLSAGLLVDRVAEDGSLDHPVSSGENIFSQFPKTCSLTGKILKADNTKAVAFTYNCLKDPKCNQLEFGGHHVSMFHDLRCRPRNTWVQVAHLKWNADTQGHLSNRVKEFGWKSSEKFWGDESSLFLAYLANHSGRVDTESECFVLPSPESPPANIIKDYNGGEVITACDGQGLKSP